MSWNWDEFRRRVLIAAEPPRPPFLATHINCRCTIVPMKRGRK